MKMKNLVKELVVFKILLVKQIERLHEIMLCLLIIIKNNIT
jgi:hypothetical protein